MSPRKASKENSNESFKLRSDRWRLLWLALVASLGFTSGILWKGEGLLTTPEGNLYIEFLIAALVLLCIWFLLWRDYQSRAIIQEKMNALNKEMKQREEANQLLENAYSEVEGKVRERTRDLTDMKNELEESNALLNAVFQTMRAGILVMQPGRKFAYANHSFNEIWGLVGEEYQFECRRLLPRLYEKAQDPDDLCKLLENIGSRTVSPDHTLIKLKDGRLLDFHTMPFLISGKEVGRIHTFRDITELQKNQIQLQETVNELETFKRALDFHAQVSICDKNGIINYVNDQLCEISGYSADEFIGKSHSMLNSDLHDNAFFQNMWETLVRGDIWRGEIRNRKKDGSFYWVHSTMVPFFDEHGEPKSFLAISADITDRKEYEAQLQGAKDAAESAARAKSEFLANISHEIRTPMNAVLGFSEILTAEIDNPRHCEYLRLLTISGNTLLELINDLLDLSKIEAGKFSLQPVPFNLRELVQEIQNIFLIRTQEKELNLLVDIDFNLPNAIVGDEVRMRQILFNLVGNAVKFTEKGYVKILVETDYIDVKNQSLTLLISVIDTGIGISEDNTVRIFEAFQQAEGQSLKKFGGTGLGLAITKRLVEMMGGNINLQSRSGQGSCFTIRIPQVSVPSESDFYQRDSTRQETPKTHFEPATILVADDDVWNRRMFTSYLRESGLTIIEAVNGNEAYEKAEQFKPDLIIMDMMLPEMNGLQVAQKLNQTEDNERTPIFLITAMNLEKMDKAYDTSQIDAYLFKPIDRKQLFTLLRRYLRTKSPENETSTSKPLKDENKPSAALIKNLDSVLEQLDTTLMEEWQQLQRRMQSNAMLDFSESILEIGERYDYVPLVTIANEIKRRVDVFDVSGMRAALKQYPEIINQLRRYQKHK